MNKSTLDRARAYWDRLDLTQGDLLGILRGLESSALRWIADARKCQEPHYPDGIQVNRALHAYDRETFGKLYPLLERAHETPVKFPEWPEDL